MKEYKVIIENDGTKRYFKPNTGRFMKELQPVLMFTQLFKIIMQPVRF